MKTLILLLLLVPSIVLAKHYETLDYTYPKELNIGDTFIFELKRARILEIREENFGSVIQFEIKLGTCSICDNSIWHRKDWITGFFGRKYDADIQHYCRMGKSLICQDCIDKYLEDLRNKLEVSK